jgi:glucose-6-phosphate isomerase
MDKIYSLDLSFSKANLSPEEIEATKNKIEKLETPYFAKYEPNIETIEKIGEKYCDKKNIIIEGNGGSISTMRAIYSCFSDQTEQNIFILDTDDPDYIAEIKKKCPKKDTLFMVINRSGNNIQTISGYLAFKDYETIFITAQNSALHEIGIKHNIISYNTSTENPQMAGRFSGNTEFALIPAAIARINTKEIANGAKEMYAKCSPLTAFSENPALQFAAHLDKLEKIGYTEIFLSIYSKKLAGFFELITQLFHESVCKNGKGQTIYGSDAPENQHHTLQRFNSGRQNSAGIFITIENFKNNFSFKVPEDIANIECRNVPIKELEKLSMADIINIEFEGTWKDTVEKGIPAMHLRLRELSPATVGMLIAFFQYAAYYSAILREVNPFDQPGVEKSKEYIFQMVKER